MAGDASLTEAGDQPQVSHGNVVGTLLDEAPCGFVSFTDAGLVRAVNTTLLEMLGYSRADLIGRHVEAILNVGSRIFYQTHFFPLLKLHGHAEEVFLLLRAKSGDDVAALVNAVRKERGAEWVIDCVFMRVVERRKFEDALLRAKHAAEEAHAAADAQRLQVEDANVQLERQALELELSQQQLLEQAEELETQSEALRSLNDELVSRGEELERLRSVAEEANRAKSSFLAVMSHELRTPLNAIGGYVQLLEMGIQGPVTPAQSEALGRISRSQRHLLRLINDVLNLARIESGRVDYDLKPFALREVAESVLPMVEPQLRARQLRYETSIPRELTVYADREKVQQILLNLLSNATKFTPAHGRVSVDARANEDGAASITVQDTGIGIPADRLEHVFEPFVQVDVSHARQSEGTGLGLAISRDLARGMGGELSASSEVGVGSVFTLTLPCAQ